MIHRWTRVALQQALGVHAGSIPPIMSTLIDSTLHEAGKLAAYDMAAQDGTLTPHEMAVWSRAVGEYGRLLDLLRLPHQAPPPPPPDPRLATMRMRRPSGTVMQ